MNRENTPYCEEGCSYDILETIRHQKHTEVGKWRDIEGVCSHEDLGMSTCSVESGIKACRDNLTMSDFANEESLSD